MYLKHQDLSKYLVYDIEADSLNPTKIWCVVVQNVATNQQYEFYGEGLYGEFRRFVEAHNDCFFVGHNILSYDNPALRRLAGVDIPFDRSIDTLVLSILYHPKMPGGHSLEAYGERFRYPKLKHEDWSQFSPAMLERCRTDVELNVKVFKALTKKMRDVGFSEKSCEIEHKARVIINEQQQNGFYFDQQSSLKFLARLEQSRADLEKGIRHLFPSTLEPVKTYERRRTTSGADYKSYQRHLEQYPRVQDNGNGTYTTYDWEEFNIGSPQQRLAKLLSLGFVPTKLTDGGNPSVDEETLIEFANEIKNEQVHAIAEWLVLSSRASMVRSWQGFVQDDGCIHGNVNSCGAGSRRMTHNKPNTANVPGNDAKYGEDCRRLWVARPGRLLVGYDAKSAQMRCFANYLPDPTAGERFYDENRDPHQENADMIGTTRKVIKNGFYANMFGAGLHKLAVTCRFAGTDKELESKGRWIRRELYRVTPGLEQLTKDAKAEFSQTEEGWIRCLDGGFVRCPSANAALNYRIQSAEAVLMKQGSIFLRERARERGLDHLKVGDIHDEGQHDVHSRDAQALGELAVQSLRDAGEELNLKVPFDGDFRIGRSWAETH